MVLHYKPAMGISFLVVATFMILVSLMLGPPQTLVAGIILLVVGALYLSRPFAEVKAKEVVVYALIGPVRKTFPFTSISELRVADGKLYLGPDMLPVSKWLVKAGDWNALIARVKG